jgi:membrane protease YdiL (CAAX protease family)
MTEFRLISAHHRKLGFLLSIGLGVTLALTFLPGIHTLFLVLNKAFKIQSPQESRWIEMSLFSCLAAIFYLSIPRSARAPETKTQTFKELSPTLILPTAIAFLFGWVLRHHFFVISEDRSQDVFWFVICIPLGEELLFRAWLWSIFKTLCRHSYFSLTNPLPSELVFTSLAFSFWHLQNQGQFSLGFLCFQLLYTFLTGAWLGYLRWRTGKIYPSVLAHSLLNLAASLPTLL